MKYASFERLVLTLGAASVLATLVLTYHTGILIQEVVAQLLVFGVLFAAVHWGRRGGFIAAIAASVAYIAMRIPLLSTTSSITTQTFVMILTRVLAYGLIGIVGGELSTRMKYVLAGLERSSELDDITGIFSQQALAPLLDRAHGRFARYDEPYCVVVLQPAQGPLTTPSTTREHALLRRVAGHIRSDIRLVDEAGRLTDGRFVVLLPHAPKEGGSVVAERLGKGIQAIVSGTSTGVFTAQCLGAAEDADALDELRAGLGPTPSQPQTLSEASPA